MSLREALDRTFLLMRDEIRADVSDDVLLGALTDTRIALVANAENITSHAAQSAFVTAAILMARSGHQVFLLAPDAPLLGAQPPLRPGRLISRLVEIGKDFLPGIEFVAGMPDGQVDIAVGFGDTQIEIPARRKFWLNATRWMAEISGGENTRKWIEPRWPFGAAAAGCLAAGEAFKAAMQSLLPFCRNADRTAALFRDTNELKFELAPADTPICADLGEFDCISGGAITNGALYTLARIPSVKARGRLFEPDNSALSNMNRYPLLLRSRLDGAKARDLAEVLGDTLRFVPFVERYDESTFAAIDSPAPRVIVGVDDIPTRWAVQRAKPRWLAIGATTHWSAMASFHEAGIGCAQCLHPEDDPNDAPIPTTACVSFWAGLLVAVLLARDVAGGPADGAHQQIYLTVFRPERPFRSPVPIRENCPSCSMTNKAISYAV